MDHLPCRAAFMIPHEHCIPLLPLVLVSHHHQSTLKPHPNRTWGNRSQQIQAHPNYRRLQLHRVQMEARQRSLTMIQQIRVLREEQEILARQTMILHRILLQHQATIMIRPKIQVRQRIQHQLLRMLLLLTADQIPVHKWSLRQL